MTLADIEIGQHVLIKQIRGQGALRRRLLEMGLTPNTMVCVRKMAPMGDPIELHLRGYSLTLRKEDANLIDINEMPINQESGPNLSRRHQHRHGGELRE
jgi:Fe2+ transport system protein FeoA